MDLKKSGITVALVALGVIAAGFLMNEFKTNDLVKKVQAGFNG